LVQQIGNDGGLDTTMNVSESKSDQF